MKIEKDFIDIIDLLSLSIESTGIKAYFRLLNKQGTEVATFLGSSENFPVSDKTEELISSLILSLEEDYAHLLLGEEPKLEESKPPKDVGDKLEEDRMTMRKWLGVKDDDFGM